MPTNYVGNPAAIQPPSAAPGAGAAPTVALPNDGEPANAASVAQAFKVAADFIGHTQASSRPDVPVLASSGSAFTAPSYNGFGGTVAPSGALHHSDGLRVVIQIQTGGAVGVATFKTSIDGGATFGATQTTAASMTDATSGITLAFAGTLTAFGTASFRSAFTPQAQWRDAAGNGRFLIGHNGYPSTDRFEFREDWVGSTSLISTTQTPITILQRWQSGIVSGATIAIVEPTPTNALITTPVASINTSATSGSTGSLLTACNIVSMQPFSSVEWRADLYPRTLAGTWSFTCGLSGANDQVNFLIGSANPNVLCQSRGPVFAPDVNSGISVASITNTLVRLRIEVHGASSPYGSPARAFYFINDALVGVITTNLPTGPMSNYFSLASTAAASASNFYVGGTSVIHNRYLSAPPL